MSETVVVSAQERKRNLFTVMLSLHFRVMIKVNSSHCFKESGNTRVTFTRSIHDLTMSGSVSLQLIGVTVNDRKTGRGIRSTTSSSFLVVYSRLSIQLIQVNLSGELHPSVHISLM
jgi:hypothetical protein